MMDSALHYGRVGAEGAATRTGAGAGRDDEQSVLPKQSFATCARRERRELDGSSGLFVAVIGREAWDVVSW